MQTAGLTNTQSNDCGALRSRHQCRFAAAALLSSLLLLGAGPASSQGLDVGANNIDWPMAGHNPAGTRWNKAASQLRPPLRALWSRTIPNYYADGISVAGETIFLSGMGTEGDGPNRVWALDTNGALRWSYTLLDGSRGAMSAVPASQSSVTYFGGQYDDRLYAVNSRTGATIWALPGVEQMYASSPIIHGSSVFAFAKRDVRAVSASQGHLQWASPAIGWAGELAIWNNTVVALSWETPPTAFDRVTGRQLWRRSDLRSYFSNIVAHEGRAYLGVRGGQVHALDLADGRTLWSVPLPNRLVFGEVEDYSVALANGVLFVAGGVRATEKSPTPQNNLFALDARSGSLLWQSQVAHEWDDPLIANGVVYVRQRRGVYPKPGAIVAFDAATGRNLWELPGISAVVANERLYVISSTEGGMSTISAYAAKQPGFYPVLFVHGLNSDGSTWSDLRERLRASGLTFGGNARLSAGVVSNSDAAIGSPRLIPGDFYTLSFSSNNGLTFEEQGWELAKVVDEIKRVNDAGRVVLVGHSMGGLASRAYLQGMARSRAGEPVGYRGDVDRLITVGTPHQGSPAPHFCQGVFLANAACLVLGGGGSTAMFILKADSPELRRLNSAPLDLPQIGYSSLVVEGMFLSLFAVQENGDGIVTATSQNLMSVVLPRNVSPLHKTVAIDLDPWCAPLGVQSHTCEPGNSIVQDAIIREAQLTRLASVLPSPGKAIGLSTTASGSLKERSLSVTVRPLNAVQQDGARLFVVALVGNQYYVRTRLTWLPWSGGPLPAFVDRLEPSQTIRVLDGELDLSPLVGSQIFVGYGRSDSEMLANGRYALVHTLR